MDLVFPKWLHADSSVPFRNRYIKIEEKDTQEIVGYYEVLDLISKNWEHPP